MMLQRVKTALVNVPKGTTSRVQPLDVSINKPFKNFVRRQFEEHIDKNLELYINGKISAAERRVLITKWVANAWQSIKGETDLIQRSFLKCGFSNALDGSEYHCVNIKGIEGYSIPDPEEEYELLLGDESEDLMSGSYDIVNLYPSFPLKVATAGYANKGFNECEQKIKLTITEIKLVSPRVICDISIYN